MAGFNHISKVASEFCQLKMCYQMPYDWDLKTRVFSSQPSHIQCIHNHSVSLIGAMELGIISMLMITAVCFIGPWQ